MIVGFLLRERVCSFHEIVCAVSCSSTVYFVVELGWFVLVCDVRRPLLRAGSSHSILAGCSFNKRVCECLLPANHPSRNIAKHNKTNSWKRTNSLVNILKNNKHCCFLFRKLTWRRMRTDRTKKLTHTKQK